MRNPYQHRAEIKDPYMTLQEIADMMGMSRERVRQIEVRALGKVKQELFKRGITAEDFFSTLKYMKPIKRNPNEILSDSTDYELIEPERNEDD
jgi:DNA-binding transcriptional regulator GbsR (MarR family)